MAEYTMEANINCYRAVRGGFYANQDENSKVIIYGNNEPMYKSAVCGSRPTLLIKP